jgi:hypothetical protein
MAHAGERRVSALNCWLPFVLCPRVAGLHAAQTVLLIQFQETYLGRSCSRIHVTSWLDSASMDDRSASVFCFTPLRVPVSELGRRAACPPSQPSPTAPVCSAPPVPEGPCPVCPRLDQDFEAFRQAAYWKAQHARALEREAQLKAEVQRLEAMVRLREQQLFGRKTETAAATAPAVPDAPRTDSPPRLPRGQQPGRPGPKRRDYSHLPSVDDPQVFPPEKCRCSRCGQPFADFPGTEDSIILEIEVRAYRRVVRRRRYRPTCSWRLIPALSRPRRHPG